MMQRFSPLFAIMLLLAAPAHAVTVANGSACTGNKAVAISGDSTLGYFSPLYCPAASSIWQKSILKAGTSAATCASGLAGLMRMNGTVLEFCNGASWAPLVNSAGTGAAYAAPTGVGYFVLTNGTWNGNLAGIKGANDKCLADLTANDWMGKTDATTRGLITSDKVRAFMCIDGYTCNDVLPSIVYTFAVSGTPAVGGATFTSTTGSVGPNNAISWAGSTYFGTDVQYWTHRSVYGTNTLWYRNGGAGNYSNSCSTFSTNDSAQVGYGGRSNNTNASRWTNLSYTCDQSLRLICIVHP